MKYAVLGIALTLTLIGVSSVYAERGMVDFPKISNDDMIGQDVQVTYQSDNRWTITVTTQFQVHSVLQLPEIIYYPAMDGQIYSINLKDGFILANRAMNYNSEEAKVIEDEAIVVQKKLEEKKIELQEELDEVYGKYNECLEQFREENPLGYEAWLRTADLQPFEVPDRTIAWYVANYSAQELKGEKAWQACEAAKKYTWIGAYEANKSMEEAEQFYELDETNSPDTPEPVTQADKDVQEQIAMDFKCSDQGKHQGLCSDYLQGDLYKPKFAHLPSWYGHYLNDRNSDPDTVKAVEDALQTQCDVYAPLYESKRGNESQYPEWLLHCPAPEADNE